MKNNNSWSGGGNPGLSQTPLVRQTGGRKYNQPLRASVTSDQLRFSPEKLKKYIFFWTTTVDLLKRKHIKVSWVRDSSSNHWNISQSAAWIQVKQHPVCEAECSMEQYGVTVWTGHWRDSMLAGACSDQKKRTLLTHWFTVCLSPGTVLFVSLLRILEAY